MTRMFEYVAGTSNKFWEIDQTGRDVLVRYGRRGTNGQVSRKAFQTTYYANQFVRKMVNEKLSKGYVEILAQNGRKTGEAAVPLDPRPTAPRKRQAKAIKPLPAEVLREVDPKTTEAIRIFQKTTGKTVPPPTPQTKTTISPQSRRGKRSSKTEQSPTPLMQPGIKPKRRIII